MIMKKFYFILAAAASVALASCTNDELVGNSPGTEKELNEAIAFGSGFKAVTRADSYGAAAADLLGNKFIVTGVKGDGTGTGQTPVFQSYTVDWVNNTAGTTESNTADWDYVGKTNLHGLAGAQAIKYWDYNTTAYDFAAYSVGKGITLTHKNAGSAAAGDIGYDAAPAAGVVYATPIVYNATQITASDPARYEITNAYMLRGSREDLTKCYITDMKTVPQASYKNEVQLQFRSLASKVRVALYETIPGYSVKNVFFYQDASTDRSTDISSNTSATLFGTNAFYAGGTYTVSFPHIGSGNSSNSDYNKAHVAITGNTTTSTQAFGTLNYTAGEDQLSGSSIYLKRSSSDPSFAGSSTYYQTVLPNETGVTLNLRVNFTLVATDGSNEEITIYGASAQVPATYTKWLPNYAYTYIFKLSDNTNGWTSPTVDPAGLYPITFDAVVKDNEETGHQTTITSVTTPSITTYQKGHVYNSSDEYKAGDIYVQAVENGTIKSDLDSKGHVYSLTGAATEADVIDALNISVTGGSHDIDGRNGLGLTTVTPTYPTAIPGEDGNDITVAANTTAKFAASASTYYAFVYDVQTGSPTEFNTAVVTSGSAPTDWVVGDGNVYYSDFACTSKVTTAWVAGTYYKKYTNKNNTYAVKVIKVQ